MRLRDTHHECLVAAGTEPPSAAEYVVICNDLMKGFSAVAN